MFNSFQPCGLQYTRLPCPSLYPGVCSNSWPLSQWCYPTISSSATPFSSCPQSFPASGSFPMSQFFTSGGQGIGASASASVVPINSQGWFPLELASPFFLNCIFCLFIYLLHHTACGILVPQPGIELGPSAVRVQSSNHWTTREFPASHIQLSFLQLYKDQVSYLVRFCF